MDNKFEGGDDMNPQPDICPITPDEVPEIKRTPDIETINSELNRINEEEVLTPVNGTVDWQSSSWPTRRKVRVAIPGSARR